MDSREETPTPIQRLFVWLAGADIACLQQCPRWERVKYEAFGASVLVPVSLGMISSAYAVSTLTENIYLIVGVAVILGGIILAMNRVLLATFRAYDSFLKKLSQFSARLLVAVVLGAAVAYPITLLLFKGSIQDQVRSDRSGEIGKIRTAANNGNFELQNKITKSSNRLEELQREYEKVLTKDFSESVAKNYDQTFASIDGELARLRTQRSEIDTRASSVTGDQSVFASDLEWQNSEFSRINTMISELTSRRLRLSSEFLKETSLTEETSESIHNHALLTAIKRQIDTEGGMLKRLSFDAEQQASETNAKVSVLKSRGGVDILAQTFALNRIISTPQKGGQFTLVVFVTIVTLFTFFDTLPMLVRFFSVPGPYDMLQHMEASKYDMFYESKSKEELLELKEKGEIFREQMELRMSLYHSLDNYWDQHVLQLPEKQVEALPEPTTLDIETEEVVVQSHNDEPREFVLDTPIPPVNEVVMQTVAQPVVKRTRRKKRVKQFPQTFTNHS